MLIVLISRVYYDHHTLFLVIVHSVGFEYLFMTVSTMDLTNVCIYGTTEKRKHFKFHFLKSETNAKIVLFVRSEEHTSELQSPMYCWVFVFVLFWYLTTKTCRIAEGENCNWAMNLTNVSSSERPRKESTLNSSSSKAKQTQK